MKLMEFLKQRLEEAEEYYRESKINDLTYNSYYAKGYKDCLLDIIRFIKESENKQSKS